MLQTAFGVCYQTVPWWVHAQRTCMRTTMGVEVSSVLEQAPRLDRCLDHGGMLHNIKTSLLHCEGMGCCWVETKAALSDCGGQWIWPV